jgi:PAS domain S-box-containing protein
MGASSVGRQSWDELSRDIQLASMLRAFAWMPDVVLFIKDRDRRFVYFSDNFPEMMGRPAKDLIGRRDEDLSPEHLVDHYRADDNAVLTTGIELADIAELVHNNRGGHDWNVTSKWPIYDSAGEIVAVGGVTRRLRDRAAVEDSYLAFSPAITLMLDSLGQNVPLSTLAASVSLSPSQFGRSFAQRFGVTPQQYQRRIRLAAACDLLSTTGLTIAAIAARCGYYDQSHMTNEFRAKKKMPPGAYRERFSARDADNA